MSSFGSASSLQYKKRRRFRQLGAQNCKFQEKGKRVLLKEGRATQFALPPSCGSAAKTMIFRLCCAMLLLLVAGTRCDAQTSAFTFHGKLTGSGSPANGDYDMQFKLRNANRVEKGTEKLSTLSRSRL
jgi:hypothetical protein